MVPVFTERSRRIWAAAEAQALGRGGTAVVADATGISASTIRRGMREVAAGDPRIGTRTRKAGGGRKRATDLDPTLLRDLDALVEPTAPGDPDSPLRWTCLSARTVAVALGDRMSHTVVAEWLHTLGYSLQGHVKTREGRQHVDRDAQCRYIARHVRAAQQRQQPTISVDTRCMGRGVYRGTDTLLITADAGGSNGARLRLWKWELQGLANRTGLAVTVCHFPPGTSKWNTIEHRLFSHIAMNWRGTPLVDLATIVSLIGSTHSRSGLRVRSELDRGAYPKGVTVTDAQMATIHLERHRFHGDWNYTIHPVTSKAN